MSDITRIDVAARLEELAVQMVEAGTDPGKEFLQQVAYELSELGREIRHEYAYMDPMADVPTPAQGVALARFLRPTFRGENPTGVMYATVFRPLDLPHGYIGVRLSNGYEGGIAPDGRTST